MNAFAALSDPTRLSIVEMLAASGQLSAGDIGGHFDMTPPAISQHLKVLREAKLVRMDKDAQRRIYSVNPAGLEEMERWASQMRQFWNERFDALDKYLKTDSRKTAYKKESGKKRRRGYKKGLATSSGDMK